MQFIMYTLEIDLPRVFGNKEFISDYIIRRIQRRSGAFLESSQKNPLKGAVIQEYISQLLQEGSPMEVYLEEEKSRTGRTSQPHTEILEQILECYENKEVDDIMFVPVKISYTQLIDSN